MIMMMMTMMVINNGDGDGDFYRTEGKEIAITKRQGLVNYSFNNAILQYQTRLHFIYTITNAILEISDSVQIDCHTVLILYDIVYY